MNYSKIKKIDEESMQHLTEGTEPSDKCLCSILYTPEEEKKGIRASIKKAFASIGQKKIERNGNGQNHLDIPLSFTKDGKGIFTTRETVKRDTSCGKCGCDKENIVLKHSYANIRIVSPDISSICPCPSDCLPDKEKIANNIKVTIERLQVDSDAVETEHSLKIEPRKVESELAARRSADSFIVNLKQETEKLKKKELKVKLKSLLLDAFHEMNVRMST